MKQYLLLACLVGCLSAVSTDYQYWNQTTNIVHTGSISPIYKNYPAPIPIYLYDAPKEANDGVFVAYGKMWGLYIKRDSPNMAGTLTHELCHYRQFAEDREYDEVECCRRAMFKWCS